MIHLHRPQSGFRRGSVIAITVIFMSFLLIGIVGAAYLLSSHLRITSLSGDYLQASYNAESALELALYRLKHRFEGYEGGRLDTWDKASEALTNSMKSTISYHMKPGEKVTIPLNGGSRQLALFYEDTVGENIHDLSSMNNTTPLLAGFPIAPATAAGNCLEVNLAGTYTGTGAANGSVESISTDLPCSATPTSVDTLTDPYPFTASKQQGQPYPFREFLNTHKQVYMLVKDTSSSQKAQLTIQLPSGANGTIAHPIAEVVAEGIYGTTIIRKFIKLPQNQTADITGSVLVTPR